MLTRTVLGCLLALLLWPGLGWGAVARVGTPATAASNPGSTCTLTYSPTAGNFLLVAFVHDAGTTVTSVVDNGASGGSTYAAGLSDVFNTNSNYRFNIYYTMAAAASVSSITITVSGSTGVGCIVSEYSGVATASALDVVSAEADGTGTTQTSNSVSPQAGDLEFGLFFNLTSTAAFTATSPFTLVSNRTITFNGVNFALTDQLNASTSTAGATTAGSVDWAAYIATFKAANAGACRRAMSLLGVGDC